MRVTVDDDQCKGHGVCWGLCPEVFELTDDGYAVVLVDTVPPEHTDAVHTAIEQCPEHAISIAE